MNFRLNKQQGGTIIGLIIGLVVGLAVAVVVAVMITKTSTPFTNKLGMTKPPEMPMQITDPNKPLYGNAYKEPPPDRPIMEKPTPSASVNDEPSEEATEQAAALLAPEADSDPDTVNSKPDSTKNTDKTAEKKAESAKKSLDKSADDRAAFYIQVGAFRDQSDAETVRAKLALMDVESTLSAKNSEGDNLYRVRIGPFHSLEELNRMRSKLAENSIDVAVIKTPK